MAIVAVVVAIMLPTGAPGPSARWSAGMADDPATGQFILAGGEEGRIPQSLFDMWTWDGHTWSVLNASLPSSLTNVGFTVTAYDPATHQYLVVGYGQTWTWNGRAWRPTGTTPRATFLPDQIAYDATHQELVMLFDTLPSHSTWTWDGSSWSRQSPTNPADIGTIVYDGATRQLLFLGYDSAAGQELMPSQVMALWTGRSWRHLTDQLPYEPGGAVAYDAATHQVVLFESLGNIQKGWRSFTLTWNGTRWTLWHPAASPSPRTGESLAYDGSTRQLLLFGGHDPESLAPYADTWAWTGTTWRKLG